MTEKQPEALRLANALNELDAQFSFPGLCGDAASELRRLHELHVLYQDKVERLEKLCYDYLGELTAMRAAKQMQQKIDDLRGAQRQWVGLTDESVVSAAARVLSDRVAALCNVDCGDMWMLHGNDSIEDARAMLEAAEAKLKENT